MAVTRQVFGSLAATVALVLLLGLVASLVPVH